MKELEERIRSEGKVLPGDVLKIDSFLNHQIDTELMEHIGQEFKRIFAEKDINKVVTIESSGIALAMATAREFGNIPIVYAKKGAAANMADDVYTAGSHSYTRKTDYYAVIAREYLDENDRVLIVDDFLADGEALNALIGICHQANARIGGIGVVVCKAYQKGKKRIMDMGYDMAILADIKAMHEDGTIEFIGD